MSTNRLTPQKPKRKTRMTNNEVPDHKLSSEDIQSLCEQHPTAYNQKTPSLPNVYPVSTREEEFEAKRSSYLFEQQLKSQLNQTRNETKNPQNDPKGLSTSVNGLKSVSTIYITSESYYDADSDDDEDEDDDDGSKVGIIPIQNETDHRMVLQNKEQSEFKTNDYSSVPNSHNMAPAFTYRSAHNGYPELTTFGKVKHQSNFTLSRDRITPDISQHKMDATSKIGYTVTDISGTQG